jgi:hypothetical protein
VKPVVVVPRAAAYVVYVSAVSEAPREGLSLLVRGVVGSLAAGGSPALWVIESVMVGRN